MAKIYGFKIESGTHRTFTNRDVLKKWLEEKYYTYESPEELYHWLQEYFEQGNMISVAGKQYGYWDCWELI